MRWVAAVDVVLLTSLCGGQAKHVESPREKRGNQVADGDVGHDSVEACALGRLDGYGQEEAVEGAERRNTVSLTEYANVWRRAQRHNSAFHALRRRDIFYLHSVVETHAFDGFPRAPPKKVVTQRGQALGRVVGDETVNARAPCRGRRLLDSPWGLAREAGRRLAISKGAVGSPCALPKK